MTPTQALNADQRFFFDHAGYSHDPRTETPEQGRARCALDLAAAEAFGRAAGLSFEWSIDPDTDSSEWSRIRPAWDAWVCVCRDAEGAVCQALAGIDFGRDGSPWGDPYRRVVEGELASLHMHETMTAAAEA